MQLFLDSYGTSLRIKQGLLEVRTLSGVNRQFTLSQVQVIFCTKGIHLSSDSIFACLEHEIPIVFLDNLGHAQGQLWSGKFGSISTIRKKQALWTQDRDAIHWVQGIIIEKIQAQIAHLEKYPSFASRTISTLKNSIEAIQNQQTEPNHEKTLDSLRGFEGYASHQYFRVLSNILPERYQFKERHFQPATDVFNTALNYLYGVLYAFVELALIKTGIDPAMGVLHTDRYNRPTMVYDCIEPYRPWADEVLMHLLIDDTLFKAIDFEKTPTNTIQMSADARSILVNHFLRFLDTSIVYKTMLRKRSTHITLDAHRLASYLKEWNKE
jgi:CRISPR-associated protein Cas1